MIGYTHIVANGSSCCFFIRIQGCICRNTVGFIRWTSRLLHEMHKTLNCLNWSRNVCKFYVWQVVSLTNEHGKSKFVAKADPLSTIRNNKLIAQGEKLETSAKLWVLVSNISPPRLKQRYTRFFFFVYFVAFRTARSHSFYFAVHVGVLHVFKEIWRWFQ